MNGTLVQPVFLFTEKSSGFSLAGSKIDIDNGQLYSGAVAWAIAQDATRAKINVAGPENNQRTGNADLQAQPRPSVAMSASFKQPIGEWNRRAARVLSMEQANLDTELCKAGNAGPESAHFTTQGYGLLTDIVNGGLKTDLSLGFEMSDADFQNDKWETYKNPFRAAAVPQLGTPSSYRGQRPLFKPLTESGSVRVDLNFPPANVVYEFPAAVVKEARRFGRHVQHCRWADPFRARHGSCGTQTTRAQRRSISESGGHPARRKITNQLPPGARPRAVCSERGTI